MSMIIDGNYYTLKKWEEFLNRLEYALIDVGCRVEFQITADSLGPLGVVIIYRQTNPYIASDIIGVRGKSLLQVFSDILNTICPATPKTVPDISRNKRKSRKPADQAQGGAA